MSRYTAFKQLAQWRRLTPEQRAAVLPCPECGATGERWEDSESNLRCDTCWAVVMPDDDRPAWATRREAA